MGLAARGRSLQARLGSKLKSSQGTQPPILIRMVEAPVSHSLLQRLKSGAIQTCSDGGTVGRDHFAWLLQDPSTSDGGMKPQQHHLASKVAGDRAESNTEAGCFPVMGTSLPSPDIWILGWMQRDCIRFPHGEWNLQLCLLPLPPGREGPGQQVMDKGTTFWAGVSARGLHRCHW